MRSMASSHFRHGRALRFLAWLPAGLVLSLLSALDSARAQGMPPITSSGLNTQVSGPITVPGGTQYTITGGTRPGAGPNLFHSFGQFGVPTANIANFLNETALPTSNILGRVTGGIPRTSSARFRPAALGTPICF